ncbi:MAG: hypothetical protein RLZZ605_1405 [Bacteroidota bacterium]|jgi:hypothetical protein
MSDKITEYLVNEIKIQNWCRKINSKPIEYVDKIKLGTIRSIRQRLKK